MSFSSDAVMTLLLSEFAVRCEASECGTVVLALEAKWISDAHVFLAAAASAKSLPEAMKRLAELFRETYPAGLLECPVSEMPPSPLKWLGPVVEGTGNHTLMVTYRMGSGAYMAVLVGACMADEQADLCAHMAENLEKDTAHILANTTI